jgi:hypothetical protein
MNKPAALWPVRCTEMFDMTGDLYKVICGTPMKHGRHKLGLSCGCEIVVLEGEHLKEKLPCMGIHPADTPATPPPGGWPQVEPPKGDDSENWKNP